MPCLPLVGVFRSWWTQPTLTSVAAACHPAGRTGPERCDGGARRTGARTRQRAPPDRVDPAGPSRRSAAADGQAGVALGHVGRPVDEDLVAVAGLPGQTRLGPLVAAPRR